jgi:hypothetical protein
MPNSNPTPKVGSVSMHQIHGAEMLEVFRGAACHPAELRSESMGVYSIAGQKNICIFLNPMAR